MTRLSVEQLLKEKQTRDPNSVTTLSLNHKALSDVSCLAEFKTLERLDLAFNNLTSLEGLKACINLKWLSVRQNKLQSLKGIEGLTKLAVLNAGKNKLTSMDEVRPLACLRALILNDNQIVSICKLDQVKDLDTLVLSRNPISEIGDSLVKVKSITKLSLSNCQIQNIGSSLKSCIELKELRLAHNDIKSLPAELAYNTKLQSLDLGNNLITRMSELKVLNSLVNLRNLNLKGNPIAEKDTLAKKVKRLLPNLHIFNARPIHKGNNNEERETVNVSSIDALDDNTEAQMEGKRDKKQDSHPDNVTDPVMDKESKRKRKKRNDEPSAEEVLVREGEDTVVGKKLKGEKLEVELNKQKHRGIENESKQKGKRTNNKPLKEVPIHRDEDGMIDKKRKKSSKERGDVDVIDDRETSFTELFTTDLAEEPKSDSENNFQGRAVQDTQSMTGLVTYPMKKKKNKKHNQHAALELVPTAEIGLGGPSAWDDE
ncbi:hypothetical protein SLE2022_004010 [Rubroshorea leprosula]